MNNIVKGPFTSEMIGRRVKRGPDWEWLDQDGNGPGTILEESSALGWVVVGWDNGTDDNAYRIGSLHENEFDLIYEEPLMTEEEFDQNRAEMWGFLKLAELALKEGLE